MQDLKETREKYFEFLDHPENKHCLMFVERGTDAMEWASKERINEIVTEAENILKSFGVK